MDTMEGTPQETSGPDTIRPELLASSSVKVRLDVLAKIQHQIQSHGQFVPDSLRIEGLIFV